MPYILDMLKKSTFDLVYHEHLSYFNVHSLKFLLEKNGLEIIDIEKINFGASGPALRVFASHKNSNFKVSNKIKTHLNIERRKGLNNFSTYYAFERIVKKNIKIKEKFN